MMPRSLPIPPLRERRSDKELEITKKLCHDPSATRQQGPSCEGFDPEFVTADGNPVTLGDRLWWLNRSASDAVLRGLTHPRDTATVRAMTDDEIEAYESHCLIAMVALRNVRIQRLKALNDEICCKTASLELSRNEIKEYEAKVEGLRGELFSLKNARDSALSQVHCLKKELKQALLDKDIEYEANQKQIRVEMARQFRYGWVQGQQPPQHRFVTSPDDYDAELGFEPGAYELFEGMHPDDRRPPDHIQ